MEHLTKLKSFLLQCRRVWQILRKPSADEFKTVSKVAALGILALGLIGFIIADGLRILKTLFS